MTEKKSYSVRFYQGVARGENDPLKKVSTLLAEIAAAIAGGGFAPQHESGGERYELRDLVSLNDGAVVRGILAVLRDDAPHIREAAGAEKPIPLEEGDAILEKNHFLFYRQNELLVWQVNGRASHVSRFEKYLTACSPGQTVVFDDVLSVNALDQLANGVVTRLEFRAAKPRNAEALDPANWESRAFEMMNDSDASTVSVEVATRSKNRGLSEVLKGVVHRLLDKETTRKVEIKLRDVEDPIDLMAECLKGKITVDMEGLYPITGQMFSELEATKSEKQAAINAYFGEGDAVLA